MTSDQELRGNFEMMAYKLGMRAIIQENLYPQVRELLFEDFGEFSNLFSERLAKESEYSPEMLYKIPAFPIKLRQLVVATSIATVVLGRWNKELGGD